MSYKCLTCGKEIKQHRRFCSDSCRRIYYQNVYITNVRIKELSKIAEKIQRDFNCTFSNRRHISNLAKKTYYYIAKQKGYSLNESVKAIKLLNHTTARHMLESITPEDLVYIKAYMNNQFTCNYSYLSEGERNRIRLNFRYNKA